MSKLNKTIKVYAKKSETNNLKQFAITNTIKVLNDIVDLHINTFEECKQAIQQMKKELFKCGIVLGSDFENAIVGELFEDKKVHGNVLELKNNPNMIICSIFIKLMPSNNLHFILKNHNGTILAKIPGQDLRQNHSKIILDKRTRTDITAPDD